MAQLSKARRDLRRSCQDPQESGPDFVDATNQRRDHKRAVSREGEQFDADDYLEKLERNAIRNAEKTMLNDAQRNAADREALQRAIDRQGLRDEFVFIPVTRERIRGAPARACRLARGGGWGWAVPREGW